MKSGFKIFLGLVVYGFTTVVVLVAGGFWWASMEFTKPGQLQEPAIIEIKPGWSLYAIGEQLLYYRVIEKPVDLYIFMGAARLTGVQADLKAGEYEFAAHISMKEALHKLVKGDVVDRRITVREGLTSFEIINILRGVKELSGEIASIPGEGSLLPETYDYRKDEPRERVVGRMQQSMTEAIDELWEKRDADLPFSTKEEALTLASIVEKETGVPEERKRVAGVFINRLRKGIALQTDPTVIYAITKGQPKNEGKGPLGRRMTTKDLQVDSPYNTYKHAGLPPGPIANPGRASIEAVLNPEQHDFIYFVADGTGGHVFATTLDEHNKNVAEWRKIRKAQKK